MNDRCVVRPISRPSRRIWEGGTFPFFAAAHRNVTPAGPTLEAFGALGASRRLFPPAARRASASLLTMSDTLPHRPPANNGKALEEACLAKALPGVGAAFPGPRPG